MVREVNGRESMKDVSNIRWLGGRKGNEEALIREGNGVEG